MLTILVLNLATLFDGKTPIVNRVFDQFGSPVSFAKVYSDDCSTTTDINGFFSLETNSDTIFVDALSFQPIKICVEDCTKPVFLQPRKPINVRTLK
jgi:hypothetical protein